MTSDSTQPAYDLESAAAMEAEKDRGEQGFAHADPVPAKPGRTLLKRDDFLTYTGVPVEDVRLPELETETSGQVYVRVRGLTGKERDRYEESLVVGKGKNATVNARNARAKLAVLSCIDEKGDRLFSDADVAWLGEKSAIALERIFDVARRLSGLTDTDVKELTDGF
jgi:hypothetical protein